MYPGRGRRNDPPLRGYSGPRGRRIGDLLSIRQLRELEEQAAREQAAREAAEEQAAREAAEKQAAEEQASFSAASLAANAREAIRQREEQIKRNIHLQGLASRTRPRFFSSSPGAAAPGDNDKYKNFTEENPDYPGLLFSKCARNIPQKNKGGEKQKKKIYKQTQKRQKKQHHRRHRRHHSTRKNKK